MLLFFSIVLSKVLISEEKIRSILNTFIDVEYPKYSTKNISSDKIKVVVDPNSKDANKTIYFKLQYEDFSLIEPDIKILDILNRYLHTVKNKSNNNNRIRQILIYKHNNIYRDYWGILSFTRIDDEYVDTSGIFTGIKMKNPKDIIDNGVLSEIGFYQPKEILKKTRKADFRNMAQLLEEIAELNNKKLFELWREENLLSDVIKLLYNTENKVYSNRRNTKCKLVCLCENLQCKSCKDIKCVDNI